MEQPSPEITRRDLFRAAAGVLVGAAIMTLEVPVDQAGTERLHDKTGIAIGNPAMQEAINKACDDPSDTKCEERAVDGVMPGLWTYGAAPTGEEIGFRALPALASEIWELGPAAEDGKGYTSEDVSRVTRGVLTGTDIPMSSRRELMAGSVSTIAFGGLYHNLTRRGTGAGVNTKVLPAHQFVAGGLFWLLQRKFGFFSALAGHVTNNIVSRRMRLW